MWENPETKPGLAVLQGQDHSLVTFLSALPDSFWHMSSRHESSVSKKESLKRTLTVCIPKNVLILVNLNELLVFSIPNIREVFRARRAQPVEQSNLNQYYYQSYFYISYYIFFQIVRKLADFYYYKSIPCYCLGRCNRIANSFLSYQFLQTSIYSSRVLKIQSKLYQSLLQVEWNFIFLECLTGLLRIRLWCPCPASSLCLHTFKQKLSSVPGILQSSGSILLPFSLL